MLIDAEIRVQLNIDVVNLCRDPWGHAPDHASPHRMTPPVNKQLMVDGCPLTKRPQKGQQCQGHTPLSTCEADGNGNGCVGCR